MLGVSPGSRPRWGSPRPRARKDASGTVRAPTRRGAGASTRRSALRCTASGLGRAAPAEETARGPPIRLRGGIDSGDRHCARLPSEHDQGTAPRRPPTASHHARTGRTEVEIAAAVLVGLAAWWWRAPGQESDRDPAIATPPVRRSSVPPGSTAGSRRCFRASPHRTPSPTRRDKPRSRRPAPAHAPWLQILSPTDFSRPSSGPRASPTPLMCI